MFKWTCEFESHRLHHKKSIGLIQFVSDLFSLQIGIFILSASNIQSLVEVPNDIFMRLFFFLYIATEQKPYQRNDRCFYGTKAFYKFYKNIRESKIMLVLIFTVECKILFSESIIIQINSVIYFKSLDKLLKKC